MNFFSTTLSFSYEKHKDIIIFDEVNSSLIKKVIPDNYSYSIYKTRPINIVITFKIILNFFLKLKYIKIIEQFSNKQSFF